MTDASSVVSSLIPSLDTAERVGLVTAVSGVGHSFSRGLLPRSTVDQAVITGASSTINYAMTALAQSVSEGLAELVIRNVSGGRTTPTKRRGLVLAGNLGAIAVGVAAQRALAQHKNEPISRAIGRTLSWRLAVAGTAGTVVAASDTLIQVLSGDGQRPWVQKVPVTVPVGAAIAATNYHLMRRRMREAGVTHDAEGVSLDEETSTSIVRSVAMGAGVATGLVAVALGERVVAGGVAHGVRAISPRADILAKPAGHLVGLGLIGAVGYEALRRVFTSAERGGAAVEAAYHEPPTSQHVSGGPHSEVSWEDIGREGRRFVNMALTTDEIETVMGEPAIPPIRVFVGLESAETTSGRADLAMRELETMGAFERKLIVFCSPTGTGYLNYVTVEALEYLTGGDVATVAMQYSLRPSPQSLDRVKIGVEQNSAFLHALKWRLAAIPKTRRPRLVIFGESLGAQTAQDAFADEGVAGFERAVIERGLFLGTPANTKWRKRWLSHPESCDPQGKAVEVDSYEEYLALPADVRKRARYFLLTHHNDPMPKFWFNLAVQAPPWIGRHGNHEPGVPPEIHWRPYTTFIITLMDVKNAMHVIPGKFVAMGHDYRKDIARFVSLSYDLPIDEDRLQSMERALRERELLWAERRLVDSQVADTQDKIREQLQAWGVPDDRIPTVMGASAQQEPDPYQAI
jgi:uncharacterized membrane protein